MKWKVREDTTLSLLIDEHLDINIWKIFIIFSVAFCYTVEENKSESQTQVNEVKGTESLSFSQLPEIEPNGTTTVTIRLKV